MVVVDEELSQTISQLTNSLFSCIGAVGAIAGATKGTFLILCLPLVYIYERIQRYFRKSNTAIARLQSVSLSPIYADFSQALTGLASIRAYGETHHFTEALENRVDYNTIASVMSQLAAQWLAIRLDFIGSLISFFIAVVAVATSKNGFIPASYLALGLTYSFQMTTYLKFAVSTSLLLLHDFLFVLPGIANISLSLSQSLPLYFSLSLSSSLALSLSLSRSLFHSLLLSLSFKPFLPPTLSLVLSLCIIPSYLFLYPY